MGNLPRIAACLLLFATGAVAAPEFQPNERTVAQVLAQQARGLLDQSFRDLPSARFQNIYAVTLKLKDPHFGQLYDGFVICGEVNDVKAGWKAFAVAADNGWAGPRDVYLEGTEGGTWMIEGFCRDRENPTVRIDQGTAYFNLVTGKAKIVHGE